jgi:hypothetical protein
LLSIPHKVYQITELANLKVTAALALARVANAASAAAGVNMTAHQAYKVQLSDHLMCRIIHLVLDDDARVLLELIFGGVPAEQRRQVMDDKSMRNNELWRDLAGLYYNNQDWKPANCVDDTRCEMLDPSKSPERILSPGILSPVSFCSFNSLFYFRADAFHVY